MKKNGLFKIILILLIAVSIITWFVPASYYSGTELAEVGMYRVGFFDFFQYISLTFQFQYFIQAILLILAIGAFYGVLSQTGAYRSILEKIAKSLKRKEKLFLVLVAFAFAALSSVFGFGIIFLLFIPAIISIILLLGYDKFTAFLTTFVAILIGVIGSTLSYNTIGFINETIGTTFSTQIYAKIALFVITFVAYIIFTLKHASAAKKSKEKIEEVDTFLGEKKTTKVAKWPIYVLFGLLFALVVLACTNWIGVFGVNIFSKAHSAIMEFTVKDHPIFSYILGNVLEFGKWSYSELSIVVVLASLLIGKIYKIKCSEIFDAMVEGAKKVLKPALLVTFAYAIVYTIGNTLFFNTISAWIVELTKTFNVFLVGKVLIIGSALHVDVVYLANFILPHIATTFGTQTGTLAVMSQSLYGLTMFVAPTSVIMILGLEYLKIPYKNWLKFIWILVLELLVIILVISFIIRYL